MLYRPIIDLLNATVNDENSVEIKTAVDEARAVAIDSYNRLPYDMQWNVQKWVGLAFPMNRKLILASLQSQCQARQGPIFLWLHLWMHTIIVSAIVVGHSLTLLRPLHVSPAPIDRVALLKIGSAHQASQEQPPLPPPTPTYGATRQGPLGTY